MLTKSKTVFFRALGCVYCPQKYSFSHLHLMEEKRFVINNSNTIEYDYLVGNRPETQHLVKIKISRKINIFFPYFDDPSFTLP